MHKTAANLHFVDSHTEGEATRLVIDGFPELGSGSILSRMEVFEAEFDPLRAAIIREPRGHDAIVGALLCTPLDGECTAGVIFFNNTGFLNMCGHGTIGLIKTLEYLERITPGKHKIETPVGIVEAVLEPDGSVSIENVPSFRFQKDLKLSTKNFGLVRGDIAWGGNWFFLTNDHQFELIPGNAKVLTEFALEIKMSLQINGLTGKNGAEVDHIELLSDSETADSRNFVLCPGNEYDRSPCGTGTSAKLACLYDDGNLKPDEVWVQESIIGSRFEGRVRISTEGNILPIIRGRAFITARGELILDERDPFCYGIDR